MAARILNVTSALARSLIGNAMKTANIFNSRRSVVLNLHCPIQILSVVNISFASKSSKGHLRAQHKICQPEQLRDQIKNDTIGKNCQGRFWCGFCKAVTGLKEKRNAAWDERFDHIAQHFEKERKNIDEWVCVRANRTKKELLREMDWDVLDDGEERDVDAVGEAMDEADDDDVTVLTSLVAGQYGMPQNQGPTTPRASISHDTASRKRNRSEVEMAYPDKRRTKVRFKSCVRLYLLICISRLTFAVPMLRILAPAFFTHRVLHVHMNYAVGVRKK